MGADAFRQGLRDYLQRFTFANASWPDLIEMLDQRTPADLAAWSHAWVDEPGRPTVEVLPRISRGRVEQISVTQTDPDGRGLVWPQRLDLYFAGGGVAPVTLDGPSTEVPSARELAAPRWILPIGGYGLFDLDPTTLEFVSRSLARIDDPYVRGTALIELWEAMLQGKVAAGRVIDDLLVALTSERDEMLIQQMLDDVQVAFWRFTAADDRPSVAPRIEAALRAGLANARSTSAKAAWFGALRRIATTPKNLEWLEAVWRRDVTIPGLPLSEDDEADLAADLALRNGADANVILQVQLDRLANPDRKARFAFVMPALSTDTAVRDAFFEKLSQRANRQREAWVLEAARYLHHPLRAGSSRRYVTPALELTLEIQETGDIFFPKRWVDATLSGYQTVQTAAEVRGFIEDLPPDYPQRLRWILLASADPLFRAAQLLNQ
jgi:aminopeptidase N